MAKKEGIVVCSECEGLKERSSWRMSSIQVYDSSWRDQDVSGYEEELLLVRHEDGCWLMG